MTIKKKFRKMINHTDNQVMKHLEEAAEKGWKQYRIQSKRDCFYIIVSELRIEDNGTLVGLRGDEVVYAFQAADWLWVVGASILDGAECVEDWHSSWLED